jgi:hypothetical protein
MIYSRRYSMIMALLLLACVSKTHGEPLTFGDGAQWRTLGADWHATEDGQIQPPQKRNIHSRAFWIGKAFSDVTVEFEYNPGYMDSGAGNAGLILRAGDGGHFYLVHFPWGGQTLRSKNFWMGIAKVSGDGYIRNVKFELIPGVPTETERWYHVKVEAEGPQIRVSVNGRRGVEITDDTFSSGFVGFAGYGYYAFRNVKVAGEEVATPAWDESVRIHNPETELPIGSRTMPTGCIAPNGDVLIGWRQTLLRSLDQGRTWSEETLPEHVPGVHDYGPTLFRTHDDRLIVQQYVNRVRAGQPVPQISLWESADSGRTWSEEVTCKVPADGWPENPPKLDVYGPLTETADGTLLRFLLGGVDISGRSWEELHTWGAAECKAYAIRSTDGGRSWSSAIEIDRPRSFYKNQRGQISGSLDFTEATGVAIGNTVTTLIRPIYSPQMWQCWSDDAGATWDSAVRTTFPGYAQTMIRTQSGAILCGHRHPQYSINVSYDDGLNWDAGTIIGYPGWAMGCMIEVEPNVVLVTYMNSDLGDINRMDQYPLLSQRVRVTPEGIFPE